MIDQEPTPATQQGVEGGDDSPLPTTVPPRRGWSLRGRATAPQEIRILAVVVAVGVLLSLTTRAFLTEANVTAVAIGSATDAIIAIAMTIVLIGGGFDLSVGAVLALSGIVLALLIQAGLSTPLAVAATLALGAIIGTVNGVIITKVRVNPLITTLGMMSIASSVALILIGRRAERDPAERSALYRARTHRRPPRVGPDHDPAGGHGRRLAAQDALVTPRLLCGGQ